MPRRITVIVTGIKIIAVLWLIAANHGPVEMTSLPDTGKNFGIDPDTCHTGPDPINYQGAAIRIALLANP